ncbi:MAG: hypothetical protein ABL961_18190 [Vicinamibacterales bacterium]
MRVAAVDDANVERVRTFLLHHAETSLFLLSNLISYGPHLGAHINSGNYRYIEHEGRVVAVFVLTRRGNLLAHTGGRGDLVDPILGACAAETMPVTGVVGEWSSAQALWRRLCATPGFVPGRALVGWSS